MEVSRHTLRSHGCNIGPTHLITVETCYSLHCCSHDDFHGHFPLYMLTSYGLHRNLENVGLLFLQARCCYCHSINNVKAPAAAFVKTVVEIYNDEMLLFCIFASVSVFSLLQKVYFLYIAAYTTS